MSWLTVTILAYFFLAVVALFDRYFLVGSIPSSKAYTFNVVILWVFASFLLIPFGLNFPAAGWIFLGLISGVVRSFAILFLSESIVRSEVSRVVPAISGFLPIFSFALFFLYFPKTEIIDLRQITPFALLVLGSILISLKKFNKEFISFKALKYPVLAAFFFALAFLLTKILFMKTDFLTGFFLTLAGGVFWLAGFILHPSSRREIFTQRITTKISGIFILGQAFGGLGSVAQTYAVFLAKPGQVPIINALEGTRHFFLLFFVFLLFHWRPAILKEEMRGSALLQKIAAALLIVAGLAFLAFE